MNEKQARDFLAFAVKTIGPVFHPDTPALDYENADGSPLFSPEEAAEFDRRIEDCFAALGDRIYDVCLGLI